MTHSIAHLLRISALDGSRGWLVHVNAPALTLYEAGSGLLHLTVDDAEESAAVFELLMGNEVPPRKEFIVQGAYEIDADLIDA